MKQLTTLSAFLIIAVVSTAQLSYRSVPSAPEHIAAYDSLENIPQASLKSLYGQMVLILDTTYFHPEANSFAPIRRDDIVDKQFEVVSAQRDKKRRQIWIVMAAKTDTVYYQVNSNSLEYPTFVTMGYYEKQKQLYTGRSLQLRFMGEFKDLNTGSKKPFGSDVNFTCAGTSIIKDGEDLIPSIVLRSTQGDEIAVPIKGFETTTSNTINLFSVE